MLKVYSFARVDAFAHGDTRDLRVLWALEEMGLPYEIVGMDHARHDLDGDAFRAKNPFGQIPVIDDDGVVVTDRVTRRRGTAAGRPPSRPSRTTFASSTS